MTTYATPFYCHECKGVNITVSDKTQFLRRNGEKKLHAGVRCRDCKHEWWSSAPQALLASRVADAAASGGGEDGG